MTEDPLTELANELAEVAVKRGVAGVSIEVVGPTGTSATAMRAKNPVIAKAVIEACRNSIAAMGAKLGPQSVIQRLSR